MSQLNSKNEKTYRLAQELSQLTGEKMTQAVNRAIRERLDKLNRTRQKTKEPRLEEVMAIADQCAALPERDARHPEEILYDDYGLPKDSIQ